jgi:hypothetical protein
MKVIVVSTDSAQELEEQVNRELTLLDYEDVIDIKFNNHFTHENGSMFEKYAAMIMIKTRP